MTDQDAPEAVSEDPGPGIPAASSKSGSNTLMVCGIVGCGVMLLGVLLLVGVGWFFASNAREFVGDVGYEQLERAVQGADLPPEQQGRLMRELGSIRDRFQDGEIGWEQMARIVERVTDGPILPMGGVLLGQALLDGDANLSQEEVADGRLQLERFARGVHEATIPRAEVKELLKTIGEEQSDGNIRITGRPTTEELRELVRIARERADAADVPPDRFEVDLAAELRKIVDEVVGTPAAVPASGSR